MGSLLKNILWTLPTQPTGVQGLCILREKSLGVWPQWHSQTEPCGFVCGPWVSAESFAWIRIYVSELRTVSPLPSSLGFFLRIKICIYPSNKLNVSWLYYCSDVEWLVAGWPCFWFYGLGQLWQQRGVATYCTLLSGFSWDHQRFSVSSPTAWEAVNLCHLLCESLDPQGRAGGDKCLTRGTIIKA